MTANAGDMAELGLKLDANGFVSAADRAIGSLVGMGDSARKTQNQIKNLAVAGGFALGELASGGARDLGSLIRAVGGLGFAFGPLIGTMTLAVASIGNAWADARKRSAEEQQKMLDELHAYEGKFSQEARKIRLASLEHQRDSLLGDIITMQPQLGRTLEQEKEINAMKAAAEKLNDRIAKLRDQIKDFDRDSAAKKFAADTKHAADEAERLKREWEQIRTAVFYATHPELRDPGQTRRDAVKAMRELDDALNGAATKDAAREQHDAAEQQKADMDQILEKLRERLRLIQAAVDAEKAHEQLLRNLGIGSIAGILSQIGGVGGGVISGALGGVVTKADGSTGFNGALGAAGIFGGLVSALMSASDAAAQNRERMRELRIEYESFTDDIQRQLGIIDDLDARIRETRRQFDEMRHTLGDNEETIRSLAAHHVISAQTAEEYIARLRMLNLEEDQYIEMLRKEAADKHLAITQDLEVRALYAAGLTEQAEAYEFVYKQQREYNQAVKDGYDVQQLAILAEVQRMEATNRAIEQVQSKIDGLNKTIAGLQDFRNALLLSPAAGLSPTAQLAEAQRQYAEIVASARGGNQDSAGRLPGAAQSLLEFARTVFGSGADFQSIFQNVLTDTGDLISQFTDQKTIQEQMLEVLQQTKDEELAKIRNLLELNLAAGEVLHGPSGTIPTVDQTPLLNAQLQAQQAGFTQLSRDMQAVQQAITELQYATSRGFDGMRADYN